MTREFAAQLKALFAIPRDRTALRKIIQMNTDTIRILMIVGIGFVVLIVVVMMAIFAAYFKLWLRAFVTKARIGPFALLFMSLRKVNPTAIVDAKIMCGPNQRESENYRLS